MNPDFLILSSAFAEIQRLIESLDTSKNSIVRVFHNRSMLTGNLRVDKGQFAINPWVTAMKWRDHMEQRGWQLVQTENNMLVSFKGTRRYVTSVVAVEMEKPLECDSQ